MKRVLIALAAAALVVGTGITAAVPASASPYSNWCGSWDPHPNEDTGTETTLAQGAGPDGSAWYIVEAKRISNQQYYIWAQLYYGKPHDQIAFLWQYNNNLDWYQCGNAEADRTATVPSSGGPVYTAGVPASMMVDYDCQTWAVNNSSSYCY